jgi:DNA-binding NarL/FixJ family response regulator
LASRDGKKTILIVDDHPAVCAGVAAMLQMQPDLVVCGAAQDVPGALLAIAELEPDLVTVDLTFNGREDGHRLIEEIRRQWPSLLVLVLSMHEEPSHAGRALKAGARGYVVKSDPFEVFLVAIRRVLAGGIHVSETLSARMLEAHAEDAWGGGPFDGLSRRESHVSRLLGQGLLPREIAVRLHLSVKTVGTYEARLKDKLGLKSKSDLLKSAIRSVHRQAKA